MLQLVRVGPADAAGWSVRTADRALAPGSYPRPASLSALAAATARRLHAQHRSSVQVGYDTSLFSGPDLGPGWPPSYISTGNVTAITALEVDQGRLTPDGQPQDANDPGNFRPRSLTPAADAAAAFASYLSRTASPCRARPSPLPRGPVRPPSPAWPRRRWRRSCSGC